MCVVPLDMMNNETGKKRRDKNVNASQTEKEKRHAKGQARVKNERVELGGA